MLSLTSNRSRVFPGAAFVAALWLTTLWLAAPSFGHSRWIVPSHTVLSGDEAQGVTFDVSVSNDMFHPDRPFGGPTMRRGPLARSVAEVTRPDGTVDRSPELTHFGRKTVFDVELAQSGTYRVEMAAPPFVITSWKKPSGERGGRAFGPRSEVADQIPEDAVDVSSVRIHSRIVTWVTRNAPTEPAPAGSGLELAGVHPNDLFAGEAVGFRLLVDGKPAPAGTEVKLTRAGTRHRNDRAELHAQAGEDGSFELTFDQAGFYLLESSVENNVEASTDGAEGVDRQSYSLFATLEVQPQ